MNVLEQTLNKISNFVLFGFKSNMNNGVILKSRLHNAIMNMVTESVESGNVQVESVEDIEILLYLELLLR